MNQILNTSLNTNSKITNAKIENIEINENNNKKIFFKLQFFLSFFAVIIFLLVFILYKYQLYKKEKISKNVISNYKISQLYSKNISNNINHNSTNSVLGIIEIPKLNISYPIFSNINEELLKISPCKFFGNMPPYSNIICIAAHNYNNNKFFSNINSLNNSDEIILFNNNGEKFSYFVFKNYEINENEMNLIYNKFSDKNSYELTLCNCNNFNNNRIIINAKTESIF